MIPLAVCSYCHTACVILILISLGGYVARISASTKTHHAWTLPVSRFKVCVALPQGLREITQQDGALLCFDEVMTGFRISKVCAPPWPFASLFQLCPRSPLESANLNHPSMRQSCAIEDKP